MELSKFRATIPVGSAPLKCAFFVSFLEPPLMDLRRRYALMLTAVAADLWLRGQGRNICGAVEALATYTTIRLAKVLATLARLMTHAEDLVCDKAECLLFATYWVKPLLHELFGAGKETMEINRQRASSVPVKALVTQTPASVEGNYHLQCLLHHSMVPSSVGQHDRPRCPS